MVMCQPVKFCILALILIACDDLNHQGKTRSIFKEYSINQLGVNQYNNVYKLAKDTLDNWIFEKLNIGKMQRFSKWELDSLLCFNTSKDKSIMAIVNQESETVNNSVNIFYGVKINGDWFFFYGPTIYPNPLDHTPLPFTKLHGIAMQEVFRGYLKKKDLGFWRNTFGKAEYEVNEEWFKSHLESGGWCGHCSTQAQWDSTFLHMSNEKWKYRDTTDYKP